MFSEAQVVPPTQLKEGEEGGGGIKSSPICLWRLQSVGCWFFSASVRFLSPLPLRASTPTAALGKGEQGAPASRDRDPHRCVEKPPSPTRVRLAPGQQLCPSAPLRARFKAGGRGERRGTGAASAGVRARVGNGHGGTGAGPPPRRSPVAPGRRRFAASVRVAGSRLSGPGRPHRAGAGAGSPPSDVLGVSDLAWGGFDIPGAGGREGEGKRGRGRASLLGAVTCEEQREEVCLRPRLAAASLGSPVLGREAFQNAALRKEMHQRVS